MSKPQSPELRRTGRNPALDPDNAATRIEAAPAPTSSGPGGPVPPENQPGHHGADEQDRPDLDAFVERFNAGPAGPGPAEGSTGGDVPDGGAGRDLRRRISAEVSERAPEVRAVVGRRVVAVRRSCAGGLRRLAGVVEPD
jgi:hypothetical protein